MENGASSHRESARIQRVQAPVIPAVAELIRSCPGTVSLGQGIVYYGPPPEAAQALAGFLDEPESHRYGPVAGMPRLQEALRAKLAAENGIEVEPASRLVVTAGGNMAFMNAVLAVTDPGDEVILPLPYYFNHEMAVAMAGARPVPVRTRADYQLDLDAIRQAVTPRTRAVVTVSPNNPTGAVYPREALRAVNDLCRERGLYHVSDEAYEYFTYGEAVHFSPGSLPGSAQHTVSLFSLSKAYGFAGWRIGYMVIPAQLAGAVGKIQDTILICPPQASQQAALGALGAGAAYCREKRGAIASSRRAVMRELEGLGRYCTVAPADGALYFWLRVHTDLPAMTVVERLVREHGVAVMPGATFGLDDACYLRLSYGALLPEQVEEGMGRLARGLRAIVEG